MSSRKPPALVRLPPASIVLDPKPAKDPAAEMARAQAVAAGLAVRAVQRLGELVEDADGRISLTACEALRRWAEPESRPPSGSDELRSISDDDLDEILKPEAPS